MTAKSNDETGASRRKVGRSKEGDLGAFAGTRHGARNNGVTSAKPEVITGQEDASFKTDPGKAKPRDAGRDI